MKFTIQRDVLLHALQGVVGVVEKRQTLPILSNILLRFCDNELAFTATDLEVELISRVTLEQSVKSEPITVPGRKFMDICRSLPDGATVELSLDSQQRCIVKSNRSRFVLATLPANDFPSVEEGAGQLEFAIKQGDLRYLMDKTHFAMAQQDVRYYLNGMLLEIQSNAIRTVATDGHRLALCNLPVALNNANLTQIILPRKGVMELSRLLNHPDQEVSLVIGTNHIRVSSDQFTFISKLIDGRYPDYKKVLPQAGDKVVICDKSLLKQAISRAAILSNEKFKGIRLQLSAGLLRIIANNPEQEEAEEELVIDYQGDELEMGLNVSYLLDVINAIDVDQIKLTFGDSTQSVLVEEVDGIQRAVYVVMPMRL